MAAAGRYIGSPTTAYSPTGIDDTGATDVTAALEAWLATVPDGTALVPTVIWLEDGQRFKVDSSFTFTLRDDIVIRGNGVIFDVTSLGDLTRAVLWFDRCTNIYLEDVHVEGTGAGSYDVLYEGQHGFTFKGCAGVTLINCSAHDVRGDWLNFAAGGALTGTNDVIVRGFTGDGADRQGISVTGGENLLVERSVFRNAVRSTVDLEPGTDARFIDGFTFQDNVCQNGGLSFIAANGKARIDNVLIARNVLSGMGMSISVNNQSTPKVRRANWTVIDNRSTFPKGSPASSGDPGGAVMIFISVDGVTVLRNIQPMQAGRDMYLVKDRTCTGVTVGGGANANTCLNALGERMP